MKFEGKFYRTVYENGNPDEDVTIIANKEDNHKYWLVVKGIVVREDLFTNDEVAIEYFTVDDRDMTGYWVKKYSDKIAEGKVEESEEVEEYIWN